MLTSTVEAEITWKHDPTAHNVPFKAAWSKWVSYPTTMEQLPIIYKDQLVSASKRMRESPMYLNLLGSQHHSSVFLKQSSSQHKLCRQSHSYR